MKKIFLQKSIFLIIFFSYVSGATLALAQSPEASAVPTPMDAPTKNPVEEELKTLREDYKTQLGIYRADERSFTLAKEQYEQLGTLTALETAVRTTQKVMQTRTDVLMTYMKILGATINMTPGIDLKEKQDLMNELTAAHDRLKTHQDVVKLAVDRLQVVKAVDDFNQLAPQVLTVSYKAASYRSYGKMQSVYDKTLTIRDEIEKHIEADETNGLKLGEKRRALAEIDRQFQSTSQGLSGIHANFIPNRNNAPRFNSATLNQTVEGLGKIYNDIYRAITFFREVEQS